MDRLWVRGRQNVHKKLLIQAAACNLALLMRLRHGSGKPRAAHDRLAGLILAFWVLAAIVYHDVLRLQITVNHPLRVGRGEMVEAWPNGKKSRLRNFTIGVARSGLTLLHRRHPHGNQAGENSLAVFVLYAAG